MKVLLVNKFFYPKGGDAVVFFATAELLKKKGHDVSFFAMQSPSDLPTEDKRYFVSNIDLNNGGGLWHQLRTAGRILYSLEAKKKISRLIEKENPDIAHLHNICHQISPSIIDALKERGIPVVMTLHDYKLTCPVYTHMTNDSVCEACAGGRFYNVLKRRCTKGSSLKSLVNMLEMYLHHNILHIYNKVDMFISPSRFLLDKTREMGFTGRITHLPNFIDASQYEPFYGATDNSIVYFGRLTRVKGLATLLRAVKGLDVTLKVIGEGPQKGELLMMAEREGFNNVVFLGYKNGADLYEEIKKSMFAVIPSEWYENNPRSIIESFALGKPAVGARIGGIPELVKEGETGMTFTSADPDDLRTKISIMSSDKTYLRTMGANGRAFVEQEFNPEKHYSNLMRIYKNAVEGV